MRRVVVSAPGKLILMGEHAVVYGRPGLVAAIDLRLRVTLRPLAGSEVRLDLPAVGESRRTGWDEVLAATREAADRWHRRFVEGRGTGEAIGVDPSELLALALGETALHLEEERPQGVSVRVDSELPVGSGLGSSAALAVATVGAYLTLRNRPLEEDRISRLALEVERRQHGLPSGVDHTAVLRGGLLWIEATSGGLVQKSLDEPAPLLSCLRPFHSGRPPESTGEVVAHVRQRRDAAGQQVDRLLDEIAEATRSFRLAISGDEPGPLLESVRRCHGALAALGVVPSEVRSVVRRVEAEGGAAKISGAGSLSGPGGGSVLIFHPEPERIANWPFLTPWAPLRTSLPAEGIRLEESA